MVGPALVVQRRQHAEHLEEWITALGIGPHRLDHFEHEFQALDAQRLGRDRDQDVVGTQERLTGVLLASRFGVDQDDVRRSRLIGAQPQARRQDEIATRRELGDHLGEITRSIQVDHFDTQ